METKTADLITAKAVEALRDYGIDPDEFVDRLAKQLTGHSLTKGEHDLAMNSVHETIKDTFGIEKLPEPSPQKLAEIIIRLKTAAPNTRKDLIELARSLPTKAGGRPRELAKNNAEARLCALISQQLADGIEKPEAIQNASIRFAVSYWTAKRAWKRYQEAAKGKTTSPKRKARRTG